MWSFFPCTYFTGNLPQYIVTTEGTKQLISYYPRNTFPLCEQGITILYVCRIIMLEEGRGSSICP